MEADLYACWNGILGEKEIFFRVRRNLGRKAEYERLVGQIEELDSKKHRIVAVLCGKVDEDYIARIRERYKKQIEGGSFAIIRA
jgi:hypothetical protein